MTTIKVSVIGQQVAVVQRPVIAAGDKNSVIVHADFDAEWKKYSKTAVFYQDEDHVYRALMDENDDCVVPWEVLATDGTMYLGIMGVKEDARKTTEVARYIIKKGAWSSSFKPSDPTPDIYDTFLAEVQRVREICEETSEAEQLFEERNEQTLLAAQTATGACYDAINALQLAWIDFDGKYPETEVGKNDQDMNGGYPSNTEV